MSPPPAGYQVEQGTPGVTLDRSEREVELLSDLRVAASLPEGELKDCAAWVGQSANLLGQHDAVDQRRRASG